MPATYAHYRFGAAMLESMPGDIRRTVKRYRRLFDVGLHGPDIFFYQNPLRISQSTEFGMKFHRLSGKDFFVRNSRLLRLGSSEAGRAYLYGVLTHYCLDSLCHPLIKKKDEEGEAEHVAVETEFDRYLLVRDGKVPPCSQDLSPHIRLTAEECALVAQFYPGSTAATVKSGVQNMARLTKLLATPAGARRTLVRKTLSLAGNSMKGLMMNNTPDPDCAFMNPQLMGLYNQACELFPVLLDQLAAHLTYNAPLGPEFSETFG